MGKNFLKGCDQKKRDLKKVIYKKKQRLHNISLKQTRMIYNTTAGWRDFS